MLDRFVDFHRFPPSERDPIRAKFPGRGAATQATGEAVDQGLLSYTHAHTHGSVMPGVLESTNGAPEKGPKLSKNALRRAKKKAEKRTVSLKLGPATLPH